MVGINKNDCNITIIMARLVHKDIDLYVEDNYSTARVSNLGEIRVIRGDATKLGNVAVCMISADRNAPNTPKNCDMAQKTMMEALPQFIDFCNGGQAQTLLIVCAYNSVSIEMCEYAKRFLHPDIAVAYKHW